MLIVKSEIFLDFKENKSYVKVYWLGCKNCELNDFFYLLIMDFFFMFQKVFKLNWSRFSDRPALNIFIKKLSIEKLTQISYLRVHKDEIFSTIKWCFSVLLFKSQFELYKIVLKFVKVSLGNQPENRQKKIWQSVKNILENSF